jgi:hypothetical protein
MSGMDENERRVERIFEIFAALRDAKLPPLERAKLEREVDVLGRLLEVPRSESEESERLTLQIIRTDAATISERLKNRQGTRMPNFNKLYSRRAELDRRFENP